MPASPSLPRLSYIVGAALLVVGLLISGFPALPVQAQTTGEVEGVVFEDQNTNTDRDEFEPGIANVSIQLRNANNQVLASTTTDANGEFAFTGVAPGLYIVAATDLSGYTSTTPNQVSVNVTAGSAATVAFGDLRTTTTTLPSQGYIWGFVINDLNANGQADSGEAGLAGVTVTLFDESNNNLGTRVTDANGFFDFGERATGAYRLTFTPPDGFNATTPADVEVSLTGEALVTQLFGSRAPFALYMPAVTVQ